MACNPKVKLPGKQLCCQHSLDPAFLWSIHPLVSSCFSWSFIVGPALRRRGWSGYPSLLSRSIVTENNCFWCYWAWFWTPPTPARLSTQSLLEWLPVAPGPWLTCICFLGSSLPPCSAFEWSMSHILLIYQHSLCLTVTQYRGLLLILCSSAKKLHLQGIFFWPQLMPFTYLEHSCGLSWDERWSGEIFLETICNRQHYRESAIKPKSIFKRGKVLENYFLLLLVVYFLNTSKNEWTCSWWALKQTWYRIFVLKTYSISRDCQPYTV